MEESILFAKKYLEDLLSFFGLNTDVYATSDEEVIELSVPSTHMNGFLIGLHGETMRALQYLVCTALSNGGYECTRANVDIADYKKGRQDRLASQSLQWIDRVKQTGKPYELQPMNPADRRIVHKVANDHGLVTESVGFGRDRRVVISPASNSNDNYVEEEPAEAVEPAPVADVAEPAEKAPPRIRKKPVDRAKGLDEYLEQQQAEARAESEKAKPDEAKLKKATKNSKE